MSGCLSLCPYKMNTINTNNFVNDQDHSPLEKQGNLSFSQNISSSSSPTKSNHSIRRTMSADMSSPKWLQNNGSPLKKVQSSEQLQSLGEEKYENDDHTIDQGGSGGAAFEDIWSSILSQKKALGSGPGSGSGQVPEPYVHPLVRRTASSLSEKSLEICTESLGSETGSDGFSYPPSEHGDSDKEEQQENDQVQEEVHDDEAFVSRKNHVEEMKGYVEVAKYNYPGNKKVGPPKSFPPPLPSLAHRDDGSNVCMRTQRKDGRLVLEAVTVSSQNCFRAQRQGGRLLLTLASDDDQDQEYEDEYDDDEDVVEDEVGEEEFDEKDAVEEKLVQRVGGNAKELAILLEERTSLPSGLINVHRSPTAVIMSKLIELTSTRNRSSWPRNYNKTVIKNLEEEKEKVEVETKKVTAKSLPPRPRVNTATTAALNAYEYYWRRSDSPTTAAVAVLKPLAGKQNVPSGGDASPQVVKDTNVNNNDNNKLLLAHNGKGGRAQEVVLVKAAAVRGVAGEKAEEYLVPLLRGCKEPRRSLLFWEPYCIATS